MRKNDKILYRCFLIAFFMHFFVLLLLFKLPVDKKAQLPQFTEIKVKLGTISENYYTNHHLSVNKKLLAESIQQFEEAEDSLYNQGMVLDQLDEKPEIPPKTKNNKIVKEANDLKKQKIISQQSVAKKKQQKRPNIKNNNANNQKYKVHKLEGIILGNSQDKEAKTKINKYEELLPLWIDKFIKVPNEAIVNNLKGDVVVRFQTSRTGRLLDFNLRKSSGVDVLDSAVLQAFINANPFIPPPDNFYPEESQFTFDVTISF